MASNGPFGTSSRLDLPRYYQTDGRFVITVTDASREERERPHERSTRIPTQHVETSSSTPANG